MIKNLNKLEVRIVSYDDANLTHKKSFYELNSAWIEKFFELEPVDIQVLSNPKLEILDKGGYVFLALLEETVVGTVALSPTCKNEYELHKFAVSDEFQGLKIGHHLMTYTLDFANKLNAKNIYLICNTSLLPALNLYRKFGFKDSDIHLNSKYERGDISLELNLDSYNS